MKNNKKSGISLIVLVITIIVIVILAVAVILSIANNNPIENANKAKFQNDLKSMQEKLELIKATNYANNNGKDFKNQDSSDISIDQITDSEEYQDKFEINNGILVYIGDNKQEEEWSKEIVSIGETNSGYKLIAGNDGIEIKDNVLSGTYTNKSESVVIIPDEVTKITGKKIEKTDESYSGEALFADVSDVKFPKNLTEIGNFTFKGNEKLTNLTIPDTVTKIGEQAFDGCSNLNLIIGENTSLGVSSVSGIKSLTLINHFKNTDVFTFWGGYEMLGLSNVGTLTIKGTNLTKEMIEEASGTSVSPSSAYTLLQKIDNGTLVLSAE